MKKKILFLIILFIPLMLWLTGKNFVYKALWYNFANIDDYTFFDNRKIEALQPDPLPMAMRKHSLSDSLQAMMDKLETVALLVVENDSIVYEKYDLGYTDSSFSNSFSMAKSVISLLVGCALDEGKIESLENPASKYLPEWVGEGREQVKIKHLLSMTAGLNWSESYASPLGLTTEAYYGSSLPSILPRLKPIHTPGTLFEYHSYDTQILAFILEKVSHKTIAEYAQEKLWTPLGMEHSALWSLDQKEGHEKAYCCLNSNARDFAKIGLLLLHQGEWKGKTIVSKTYLEQAFKPSLALDEETGLPSVSYGYQFWRLPLASKDTIVYCRGILGQYIIPLPKQNRVVVRLGKQKGEKIRGHYEESYALAEEIGKW